MWRRNDCGGGEDGVRALIEFLANESSCQTKGERESLCRGRERHKNNSTRVQYGVVSSAEEPSGIRRRLMFGQSGKA